MAILICFVFRYRSHNMSLIFPKFKIAQNAAKKISKTVKAKMQNYEIEHNWMKLSFDID